MMTVPHKLKLKHKTFYLHLNLHRTKKTTTKKTTQKALYLKIL